MSAASSYTLISDVLTRAGAALSAAETHGVLCGYLCALPEPGGEPWLQHVLGEVEGNDRLAEEARRVLVRLKDFVAGQLLEPETEFSPMLPDDGQPLARRTAALGGWCEGFLFGLGLGSFDNLQTLSREGQEFVRDLVAFSRIASPDEEGEEQEAAYMELVEYIRVGVLTLYEEQVYRKREDDGQE